MKIDLTNNLSRYQKRIVKRHVVDKKQSYTLRQVVAILGINLTEALNVAKPLYKNGIDPDEKLYSFGCLYDRVEDLYSRLLPLANTAPRYKLVLRFTAKQQTLFKKLIQELEETPGYDSEYDRYGRVSLERWCSKAGIDPDEIHSDRIQTTWDDTCGIGGGHHRPIGNNIKAFELVSEFERLMHQEVLRLID